MKSLLLSGLLLAAATPLPMAAQGSIISNGGFENPSVAPWTFAGPGSVTLGGQSPFDGAQFASLNFLSAFGAETAQLSQSFTLNAPAVITLSFAVRYLEFTGLGAPVDFFTSVDGLDVEHSPVPFGGSSAFQAPWTVITTSFTLGAGSHTLTFNASRGETGFGRGPNFNVDGVSLTAAPVPEPSALAAAGLGFVLLAARRVRTSRG